MSVDQDAKHWFVLLKGKRYGPYALAALVQAVGKGVVDRDAGVWCLGWDEWRIARDVPELFKPEEPAVAPEPMDVKAEEKAPAPAAAGTKSGKEDDSAAVPPEKHGAQEDRVPDAVAAQDRAAGARAAGDLVVGDLSGGVPAAGARDSGDRDSGDAGSGERGRREPGGLGFLRGRRDGGRDAGRREPSLGKPASLDDASRETAPKKEPVLPDLGPRDLSARELGSREVGRDSRRMGRAGADLRAARDEQADPETVAGETDIDTVANTVTNTITATDTVEQEETASLAAGKALIPERRLSDIGNLRSPLRGGDTPAAKDEAPAVDLAAGPPIAGRGRVSEPKPAVISQAPATARRAGRGGGVGLAIVSVIAVLAILSAVVWAAMALGIIRVEFMPKQSQAKIGGKAPSSPSLQSLRGAGAALAQEPVDGIPGLVANLPAVAALKIADPDAYAKFIKRFAASDRGSEAEDETLTRARSALRKSIKPMLAKASTESLLEVTEVNLAYMRALKEGNPGSCVALSDESKGAAMDSNLAREFPPLFEREMAVLQRIIANESGKDPAPSEAEVRPFLEAVFAGLKKKPVQTQLLGRDKLTAAEYTPYCDLVIAFYEGVRALPFGDAVKLLRNLYAAAAADPDSDLK